MVGPLGRSNLMEVCEPSNRTAPGLRLCGHDEGPSAMGPRGLVCSMDTHPASPPEQTMGL